MKNRMEDKTVLVVDDDDMNLQIATMVLERRVHCRVLTADNGRTAIKILREQDVDLVLLDIMMPDFDGIETLTEIRADDFLRDVAVMMLTTSGDADDIKHAVALGVIDYIKKPFLPADFVERVTKKLETIEHIAPEKILLVGDDEPAIQSAQRLLEDSMTCEVLTAVSMSTSTEILRDVEVNLIIVDANIKFIDGFRLMKFVAGDERFANVPFVLTTCEALGDMLAKISADDISDATPAEKIFDAAEKISDEKISDGVEKILDSEKNPARNVAVDNSRGKVADVVTTVIGYKLNVQI